MSRKALNLGLMIVLALLCAVTWLVREDYARPNIEFFPDMAHSIPSDSFAANRVFADGKTLQQPVAGTIPRGRPTLRYQPTEEDAIRAGEELTSPFDADDRPETRRGSELYSSFCSHCHGGGGNGDGEVGLHGFPAPPSLLAPEAIELPDGRIFHVISFGQKKMPPHAIQIDQEDRWRIILHIRSLQLKSQEAAVTPAPAPEAELTPEIEETPEP